MHNSGMEERTDLPIREFDVLRVNLFDRLSHFDVERHDAQAVHPFGEAVKRQASRGTAARRGQWSELKSRVVGRLVHQQWMLLVMHWPPIRFPHQVSRAAAPRDT